MKRSIGSILFASAILAVGIGCSNSETAKQPDFYPLAVGNSWNYDVSEIKFDTLIQNVVLSYEEKFEIVDKYENAVHETVFVIHRSTRDNDSDDWTYHDTWSARRTYLNELIVAKENVQYVEQVEPMSNGLTWLGNKYNTVESTRSNNRIDHFKVSDLGKAYSTYSATARVTESNDQNLDYKDIRYTYYALDVGQVYRYDSYVEYCDDPGCFGLGVRNHEATKIETLISFQTSVP